MPASPAFSINGGSVGVKASVSAGGAIVATLDSTDGVRSVTWSIVGTDETTTAADYTLVPSGSVGQTVSFTADAAGTAGILQAEINAGINQQTGSPDPTTRARVKWYVLTARGIELGCTNETNESDPASGWTGVVNGMGRGLDTAFSAADEAKLDTLSARDVITVLNDPVTVAVGQYVIIQGSGAVTLADFDDSVASGIWDVIYIVNTSGGTRTIATESGETINGEASPFTMFDGSSAFFVPQFTSGNENFQVMVPLEEDPVVVGGTIPANATAGDEFNFEFDFRSSTYLTLVEAYLKPIGAEIAANGSNYVTFTIDSTEGATGDPYGLDAGSRNTSSSALEANLDNSVALSGTASFKRLGKGFYPRVKVTKAGSGVATPDIRVVLVYRRYAL